MAVTDVPLTLGVAVALALMVSGRIELAGLAAGIAMSFKYPGIFLLVPLVVAGWRQWRRLAIGLVAAARGLLRHEPVLRRPPLERASATRCASNGSRGRAGSGSSTTTSPRSRSSTASGTALGPALLVCVLGLVVALVQRGAATT